MDSKLVATFHHKSVHPTQLQLKQSLVPHDFFPSLHGYVVNGWPFTWSLMSPLMHFNVLDVCILMSCSMYELGPLWAVVCMNWRVLSACFAVASSKYFISLYFRTFMLLVDFRLRCGCIVVVASFVKQGKMSFLVSFFVDACKTQIENLWLLHSCMKSMLVLISFHTEESD